MEFPCMQFQVIQENKEVSITVWAIQLAYLTGKKLLDYFPFCIVIHF